MDVLTTSKNLWINNNIIAFIIKHNQTKNAPISECISIIRGQIVDNSKKNVKK